MSQIEVRIVSLEPMRVISAYGFGEGPEGIAWDKLNAWAGPRGYLSDVENHPTYGFNNPNPTPGSPNYGYEIWMKVDADEPPAEGLTFKDFAGGLYAVTRFTNLNRISEVWHQLVAWRESSRYSCGNHQWLELLLNPLETDIEKYTFDLYLPIRE